MDYPDSVLDLLPLMAFRAGEGTQEFGILDEISRYLPKQSRSAVEFGQRTLGGGTLAELIRKTDWQLLNLDALADHEYLSEPGTAQLGQWQLAKHTIMPGTINELLDHYGIPADPTVLVIDIDGMDYWCLQSILAKRQPELVVVEYNCHLPANLQVSLTLNNQHTYRRDKHYGASLAAFNALAERSRYRLVHIHGPLNLYFVRDDISIPDRWPIAEAVINQGALDRIADVESFYDYFHNGARPTWHTAKSPDHRRRPWIVLHDNTAPKQTINVGGIRINALKDDRGGDHYRQRIHKEDSVSPLWPLIRTALEPTTLIDIGANYGFTASLLGSALDVRKLTCIEPDPRVVPLLRENLEANLSDCSTTVIQACCGVFGDREVTPMAVNPTSSQDNRVYPEKNWLSIQVPTVTLDELLSEIPEAESLFIKSDTQGFDISVIRSGLQQLRRIRRWTLRCEFAPYWMRSQGFRPETELAWICDNFFVYEAPARTSWLADMETTFAKPLHSDVARAFTGYVESLNHNNLGWVDLYVFPVRPQSLKTAVSSRV